MFVELPPPDIEIPVDTKNAEELLENNRVIWVVARGQETLERYKRSRQAMANLDFILEQALALGYFSGGHMTPDGDFMPTGNLEGSANGISQQIAALPEVEEEAYARL